MSSRLMAIAGLAGALVCAASAQAQSQAGPSTREACAADKAKFCGTVAKDQMKDCMKSHRDQFSPECKSAIAARKQAMRAQGAPQSAPPQN